MSDRRLVFILVLFLLSSSLFVVGSLRVNADSSQNINKLLEELVTSPKREEVIKRIGLIGEAAIEPLIKELHKYSDIRDKNYSYGMVGYIFRALESIGKPAVPAVIELVLQSDPYWQSVILGEAEVALIRLLEPAEIIQSFLVYIEDVKAGKNVRLLLAKVIVDLVRSEFDKIEQVKSAIAVLELPQNRSFLERNLILQELLLLLKEAINITELPRIELTEINNKGKIVVEELSEFVVALPAIKGCGRIVMDEKFDDYVLFFLDRKNDIGGKDLFRFFLAFPVKQELNFYIRGGVTSPNDYIPVYTVEIDAKKIPESTKKEIYLKLMRSTSEKLAKFSLSTLGDSKYKNWYEQGFLKDYLLSLCRYEAEGLGEELDFARRERRHALGFLLSEVTNVSDQGSLTNWLRWKEKEDYSSLNKENRSDFSVVIENKFKTINQGDK